jgi:pimeloyl-ACP methyl ester carboxylesterase
MKTLHLLLLLASVLLLVVPVEAKTYLLVHGAWHGAWCWQKVVPLLEAPGVQVLTIELPSHGPDTLRLANVTLQDDVQAVVETASRQSGPVILVGHSMAGVVIAQAAEILGKQKVTKLVFLDAFMPKDGESVFSLVGKATAANKAAGKPVGAPTLSESLLFTQSQKAVRVGYDQVAHFFYHDCLPQDVAFAQAHLSWQATSALATPVRVTQAGYGAIPKVYILCSQAKDLDKSSLAENVACQKVYTLASGHSPFFSMPDKLAAILKEQ